MIDAAEQERDECLNRIDAIQHAIDNPVENNDNNTTYEIKQHHLHYLQTQEWNRIRDINTKINLLENNDHQTDLPIHHDTPPNPPTTQLRLGVKNTQRDVEHCPADTPSMAHNTLTRPPQPKHLTLAIPHHNNTTEVPQKFGINQIYNLNYSVKRSGHQTTAPIPHLNTATHDEDHITLTSHDTEINTNQ